MELLAKTHSAARRANDHELGLKIGVREKSFAARRDHHVTGAMQSHCRSIIIDWDLLYLSGRLRSATGDIESGDRPHGVSTPAQ
jgi:hypothetical protein